MPFAFLNPWFWLGLLAVAAPVWLHLRRKQETNLIRFSALQFLDDSPTPRHSPLQLQNLFLFALRLLAMLAIVAAFTWPYWRHLIPNPIEESRVYILDNTLSHQADGGFIKDRRRVIDEISGLPNSTQVAVIELTSDARVAVTFGDDRAAAHRKLQELTPSHQRGPYLAAFRQASLLLANSLGTKKRIVFCGDNQENQWTENANSPPFLQNVETTLPATPSTNAPNLALSEPRLQRIFLGDQSLVNLTLNLTHLGNAKTCQVILRTNDQVLADRPVELANESGTILLQTQWESDPAHWIQGDATVTGAPDSLAADNRVFFSLPPVTEGTVALLAQSSYARIALSPEIMRGHWATRVLEPSKLAAELSSLRDADVLLLESYYLQSSDARKLVWRYLTNGWGVIVFVNRVSPVISGAMRELGFEVQAAPGKRIEQRFRYVAHQNPIFHPFLSPDFGNLMDVRVSHYTRLKAPEASPLIFSESGDPLFFESVKFHGRLLVTAFGADREDSNWPTHLTFIPFIDLCLQNARAQSTLQLNYEPAQTALIELPSDSPVKQIVLREQNRELQRIAVGKAGAQFRLPDKPGLYAVTYDDALAPVKIFSINPSPKESELRYLKSPGTLDVWRLNRDQERQASKQASAKIEVDIAAIRQQEWWWWLLVVGLIALALETAAASLRKQRI